MSSHLSYGVSSSYQADLLREAKLQRRANGHGGESLVRRALGRLRSNTRTDVPARTTYEVAPTGR
jgi:hypothetical protein